MKFKRVSDHFWKVESMGVIIIGTWEQCQKEIEKLNESYLKN